MITTKEIHDNVNNSKEYEDDFNDKVEAKW